MTESLYLKDAYENYGGWQTVSELIQLGKMNVRDFNKAYDCLKKYNRIMEEVETGHLTEEDLASMWTSIIKATYEEIEDILNIIKLTKGVI